LLVDKSELGSATLMALFVLVKDGVIQKMFIEPQKPGDPTRCRTPTPC